MGIETIVVVIEEDGPISIVATDHGGRPRHEAPAALRAGIDAWLTAPDPAS